MGGDDRRPFRKRNFADKARALDARIVNEDVDRIRPRVDRLEHFSDAVRISNVGFEIDNAARGSAAGNLSTEGTLAASASNLSAIAVAYSARGAGDDGDAGQ
jgi:hypothetical protein